MDIEGQKGSNTGKILSLMKHYFDERDSVFPPRPPLGVGVEVYMDRGFHPTDKIRVHLDHWIPEDWSRWETLMYFRDSVEQWRNFVLQIQPPRFWDITQTFRKRPDAQTEG